LETVWFHQDNTTRAPAIDRRIGLAPLTHLQQLEAESIHIIREAVAECENPVMLYSIGKDSSVLLHLALKAFHPAKPPCKGRTRMMPSF